MVSRQFATHVKDFVTLTVARPQVTYTTRTEKHRTKFRDGVKATCTPDPETRGQTRDTRVRACERGHAGALLSSMPTAALHVPGVMPRLLPP